MGIKKNKFLSVDLTIKIFFYSTLVLESVMTGNGSHSFELCENLVFCEEQGFILIQ